LHKIYVWITFLSFIIYFCIYQRVMEGKLQTCRLWFLQCIFMWIHMLISNHVKCNNYSVLKLKTKWTQNLDRNNSYFYIPLLNKYSILSRIENLQVCYLGVVTCVAAHFIINLAINISEGCHIKGFVTNCLL
jgi:hypothetical protein